MEDWLKFKRYPHIGIPLTKKDSNWIRDYITDPDKIAKHKFTPLIHRKIYQRRYRPDENASINKFGKRERSVQDKKERSLFLTSHLDSIVYSYYSYKLLDKYESFLKKSKFW